MFEIFLSLHNRFYPYDIADVENDIYIRSIKHTKFIIWNISTLEFNSMNLIMCRTSTSEINLVDN